MRKYFFLVFMSIGNLAFADINVDKMSLDIFPNDTKQQNIFVYNNGDETAYVESNVFEIKNPGMKNEARNPVDIKDKNRLVVAPNKLTIEPSDKRRLQFIINEKNLKEDKIYRVSVAPKISGVETGKGLNIKILIGYDILVVARPDKPKFDLEVKRGDDSITFINKGNTNILLNSIRQCKNENDCTNIISQRLYARNEITAKLIYKDKPVIAEMFYGTEVKMEKY